MNHQSTVAKRDLWGRIAAGSSSDRLSLGLWPWDFAQNLSPGTKKAVRYPVNTIYERRVNAVIGN
jgi:hypothetical protein